EGDPRQRPRRAIGGRWRDRRLPAHRVRCGAAQPLREDHGAGPGDEAGGRGRERTARAVLGGGAVSHRTAAGARSRNGRPPGPPPPRGGRPAGGGGGGRAVVGGGAGGVSLPGGLAPRAAAATPRQRTGPSLNSFPLGFDVPSFDEREPAAHAAREIGTRHHVLMITPELFLEGLRTLAPLLDEPIADQSLVPTYLVARHARTMVKVGLVGEGSDELFAGYPTSPGGVLAARYRRLPPRLRRMLAASAPRLGAPHGNVTFRYLLRRFLELAEAPAVVRHRAWMGAIGDEA